MNLLLQGAIMMAYATAGLFFFRFWRETRDRLFALFAIAFWILSLDYLVLSPSQDLEGLPLHYTVRFFAFFLILIGIADKNYINRKRP